jgi:hypothetical protein
LNPKSNRLDEKARKPSTSNRSALFCSMIEATGGNERSWRGPPNSLERLHFGLETLNRLERQTLNLFVSEILNRKVLKVFLGVV